MITRDKYNKYELKLKIKVAINVYGYDWIILTNLGYRNTKFIAIVFFIIDLVSFLLFVLITFGMSGKKQAS